MKRVLLFARAYGCAQEQPATTTIAPADPRPALAPGRALVTIEEGRIGAPLQLPAENASP